MNLLLISLWGIILHSGSYAKAVPYYEETAKERHEIGGVNVHQRLAESLSAAGEFEEAISWYEKAAAEHTEPNTIFGYGFTAYQAGMVKTAIKQLSDLKGLDPSYSSLYMPLAKAMRQKACMKMH